MTKINNLIKSGQLHSAAKAILAAEIANGNSFAKSKEWLSKNGYAENAVDNHVGLDDDQYDRPALVLTIVRMI